MPKKRKLISINRAAELRGTTRQAIQNLINRKKLTVYEYTITSHLLDEDEVKNYENQKAGRPKKSPSPPAKKQGRKKIV